MFSERFKNFNNENLLVYIMKYGEDGWYKNIKTMKGDINMLIIKRNEIAKWQKKGEEPLDFEDTYDVDDNSVDVIKLPPMKTANKPEMNWHCKRCFDSTVCSLAALSFEKNGEKKYPNEHG